MDSWQTYNHVYVYSTSNTSTSPNPWSIARTLIRDHERSTPPAEPPACLYCGGRSVYTNHRNGRECAGCGAPR